MQEKRAKGMDSLRRGIARIDLGGHVDKGSEESTPRGQIDIKNSPSLHHNNVSTSASTATTDGDDEEIPKTPIRPSAKALGKRRAQEPPERGPDAFDPDDLFKTEQARTPMSMEEEMLELDNPSRPKPVHYVYDAAAEREKERQRAMLAAEQAQGPKAALINGLVH